MSRHASPTISDIKQDDVSTNFSNFSTIFEGLEHNSTYYVRAYAMNQVGIGYGEIFEVYTSSIPLAETGTVEIINPTEVVLTATVNDLNSQIEIWFEIWRDGEDVRKVNIQKTGAQSVSEVSARATNLTNGKRYSYTIKVKNSYGTATGEEKSFLLPHEIVTDGDGNEYLSYEIGDQIWTVENLKTTVFLNGDPISNIQLDTEWVTTKSPAYCYYNNDPELGKVYGALYNNYVGLDGTELVKGYRVPTIQECETLVSYLGKGTTASRKLKSNTDDWYNGGKGDNSSYFNALPGGVRGWKNTFGGYTYQACFQTTTKMEGLGAYYALYIYYDDYPPIVTVGGSSPYYGHNIRLIKIKTEQ